MLGIRRQMGMGVLLTHTENGFGSIANILLIIGAGGVQRDFEIQRRR